MLYYPVFSLIKQVEKDAAKARDRKAFEIYEEQAKLNFPHEFFEFFK